MSDDDDSDNDYINIGPDSEDEGSSYLNIVNEYEPAQEAQEAQPQEGVEGAQPLVEEAQPLVEEAQPQEGVEGAQLLVEEAQPQEGVEEAQPLVRPPLGVTSIKDLPANFSFETYDLKMFGDEELDSDQFEEHYNSEANDDETRQQISLMKLSSPTNKVFVGLNLYEKDLTGFNFDNKTFISCVFIRANLSKVSMRNAVLYDCHCQETNATDINLSGSMLYECKLLRANFTNAVMKNLYCKYPNDEQYDRWPSIVDIMASDNLILPEKEMLRVDFTQCNFTNAIFDNSLLNYLDFVNSELKYTSMRNCSLKRSNFYRATLHEANFTNSNCSDAEFETADCIQVCFNNAILDRANCVKGNFSHCDFRRSKLTLCYFTGANLSYSIFQNCKANNIVLIRATLYKCFFDKVNMNHANLSEAQLNGSIIINSSLESVSGKKANCCDVFFKDSNLSDIYFGNAILLKTTFVNCNINDANLDGAFMIEELITNFRRTGVIDGRWRAPTEPLQNEAEVCAIPDIEVPEYNLPEQEDALPHPASSASSASSASEIELNTTSEFYWNPALETVAELIHPEEDDEGEIDLPFVNDAGIRIRCPDERDVMVVKEIYKYKNNYMEEGNTLLEFMNTTNYLVPPTAPLKESLKFMNFKNCNFEGINFSGLNLTGINFFGCVLQDTNFTDCIIKDTNFQWSDLISVNFSGINFEGDYNAGGLLEGATIMACNFEETTFNGEDRSGIYNAETTIMPYSPKPYPEEDALTIAEPYNLINSNANAIIKSDIEGIQETEVKINDFLEQSPNNLAFRVIDYGNNYNDFLLEKDYVNKFLVNDKSVVYPCRKPFNVPGPSYPGEGEVSYHDITRPFVNIGIMLGKRVWVQKDKFMNAYNTVVLHNASEPPTTKKGLAFFKDEHAETVPTFVSKPVLFDNDSWVSALHCNSGAETETLWYVKIVDIAAIELELPVEEEGENPFAFEDEEEPAAFQGEYIDPYADESDTDSEPPALAAAVTYNPPPDNKTVSIPLPEPLFDINNATGKITRINPQTKDITVLNSNENIESQFNSAATATIALVVKDGDVTTNYIVKFNDFIELFGNNKEDYIPCKNLADNIDIDKERRLINIGAIIKKQIYIDKRQIIDLFPNNTAVLAAKKTRTFYLQFNENSEKIPGVTKFDLPAPICKGPAITVWDLQRFPNNFYQVNDLVKLLIPEEHAEELFRIAPIPPLESEIYINVFDNVPADVQRFTLAAMPDITIENGKIYKTVTGDQTKIRHYFLQNDVIGHPILVPSDAIEKEVEALVQMTEGALAQIRDINRDIIAQDTVYGHDDYLGDFQGTVLLTPSSEPGENTIVFFQPLSNFEDYGVYNEEHHQFSFQNPVFQSTNNITVIDGKIFMNGVRQYLVQLESSISGIGRGNGVPGSLPELRPVTQIHLDDGFKDGDIVVGETERYGNFEGTIMKLPENYELGMGDEIYNGHVYLGAERPANKERKYLVRIDRITNYNNEIPTEPELFLASRLTLKNMYASSSAPSTPDAPLAHEITFNNGDTVTGFHDVLNNFTGTITDVPENYYEEYELPVNDDGVVATLIDGHLYFGNELQYLVTVTDVENYQTAVPVDPVLIPARDLTLRNPDEPAADAWPPAAPDSSGGGIKLRKYNTTLRQHKRHNNNTLRNHRIHKTRHLHPRLFRRAFTKRIK